MIRKKKKRRRKIQGGDIGEIEDKKTGKKSTCS
jgi:hypothetical protein